MSPSGPFLGPDDALPLRQMQASRRHGARRTKTRHAFRAATSLNQLRKAQEVEHGIGLQNLYIGIAVAEGIGGTIDVGFASHDGTYSIDFAVTTLGGKNGLSGTDSGRDTPGLSGAQTPSGVMTPSGLRTPLPPEERPMVLADYLVEKITEYQRSHLYKFVGAGLTKEVIEMSPDLPARLWEELDIVPLVFVREPDEERPPKLEHSSIMVDEEADSMARKCLMYFGPNQQPRVQVFFRNRVAVDANGQIRITVAKQYPETVGKRTWDATMQYANSLKQNNVKIAFFNSTPQGGGVALMRHALIRFLDLINVNAAWYVPKPKPEVFRITKNNHNILQGVADPKVRLTDNQIHILDDWCKQNAERFWISSSSDGKKAGPLAPRSKGGADVIIVDDPQMPSLVQIAKQIDPERPVIYRSHIQVRADLADQEGTPTSEVWNWVWNNVKDADVFVSHPVREFVPNSVDFKKVGYMPATTDWLDGLNKEMSDWDSDYYMHEFDTECFKMRMFRLDHPHRKYIVQIARFDPAKGIPDVLASYAKLRREYMKDMEREQTPQLVVAGHGAIDDPDATLIYDQTLNLLETQYTDIKEDVIVMRLGPTDQLLNVLISNAHIALQLSTREGFEVKVSEALHKGIPIIATKAGGIPLQVEHGKSGYLVEPGDSSAVAKYLHYLFTDQEAYDTMSEYAATHVSDEVGTVGNALCWLYLADVLSQGRNIEPNSAWINDMAREEAGLPYEKSEPRLPRDKKLDLTSPTEG
ncbi:trehalose synthase (Ccg-9) [Lindgomyces ingoldianus]|uniref:Trehalose synthase (Ccg-9) n=1 Tax=Lindgomyces ingoldianus TaxID=673940 RepID=A0ACB6Q9W8_9PLEO|nr:trehalose synthase (Ccg-9) [Lindgomyces ingoldianus]KAF2463753.1 trehalose synthase (Ccg-9) [Lindgomyces ingoldianus]